MGRVNDRRTIAAAATQRAVIEAASRLFVERGYHPTTISGIASEAGVAVQTVYNSIGAKRDVLAKVLDYAAAGEHAPTPAPAVVRAQTEPERDPRTIIDQLVAFWHESRARTAPYYQVLRQAAALDPEIAELERERAEDRLGSYRELADGLAQRHGLRDGLSIDDAAAIIHATGHPDLYRFLVLEQRWSTRRWAKWVQTTLQAALLAPS
jgi:AcrR family transcriptional regulator